MTTTRGAPHSHRHTPLDCAHLTQEVNYVNMSTIISCSPSPNMKECASNTDDDDDDIDDNWVLADSCAECGMPNTACQRYATTNVELTKNIYTDSASANRRLGEWWKKPPNTQNIWHQANRNKQYVNETRRPNDQTIETLWVITSPTDWPSSRVDIRVSIKHAH